MNLVLLSGGSGKRLWPLSNEIRSKQFLKLFKDENGVSESILQRVFKQIKKVDKQATITIATNKLQEGLITSQLSEEVSICLEPERKDTFPAIVLAVAFLHDIKKIKSNDIVIVCPVDPYVNLSFFENLIKLEDIVKTKDTNIALMGINPTYPSEKYGYIIPKTNQEISDVKSFKEKPDKKTAEQYIKENALWNAGVFAFKIEYILKIAHQIFGYSDYKTLFLNYSKLNKISFDYAVVEKEKKIKVLRYKGIWDDIGTWNAITNLLDTATIGNGVIKRSCNISIINELKIPVACIGGKDLVIVAGPDGILVSNKDETENVKLIADEINHNLRYLEYDWGNKKIIDDDKNTTTYKIVLKKDRRYIFNNTKIKIVSILSGIGKYIENDNYYRTESGDNWRVKNDTDSYIVAESDLTFILSEIEMEK